MEGEGRSVGHRHFVPDLGRFISRDPIGFQGGLNLFNGAGANPVNYVDPSGLELRWMMVPQGRLERGKCSSEPVVEAETPGHTWLEIWEGDKKLYSVGAYPDSGLSSPDAYSGSPKARMITSWPTNPGENARMMTYFQRLVDNQKPNQWYSDSNDPSSLNSTLEVGSVRLTYPDRTKLRVCTTSSRELIKRSLNPKEDIPLLFQPNNLYNHYNPETPLPKGNFSVDGVPSPP